MEAAEVNESIRAQEEIRDKRRDDVQLGWKDIEKMKQVNWVM